MTRYALKLELLRLAAMYPEHAEVLNKASALIPSSPMHDAADSEVREMWRYVDFLKERISDLEEGRKGGPP